MRVSRPASLVLFGATLLTSVAAASPAAAPADPTTPAAAVDPAKPASGTTAAAAAARAAELHERAMEAGAANKWRKGAKLHKQAAALHMATDGRGSRCLELAANLLYYGGDLAAARVALAEAGDLALARGDVMVAADSYLKAGLVARDQRDGAAFVDFTRKAQLLANSTHLSDEQRASIRARIIE
jgi:hypothetical protein